MVTLDKLTDEVPGKLIRHNGAAAQIREWQDLGMVDETFSMEAIFNGQKSINDTNGAGGDYRFLPLDTRHFKDLELEILDVLGNLDEALDGELVHSENWQALNTLQRRYREKVKCVPIDPPYNTGNNDFNYRDSYKHSSWLSMIQNRFAACHPFMVSDGAIFSFIDDNEQHHLHTLMDMIFGEPDFVSNYIWKARSGKDHTAKHVSSNHEHILCYAANKGSLEFAKDIRVMTGGKYSDQRGIH